MARQARAYLVLVVGVEVELCERPQAGGRDGSRKTRIANAHGDDFPGGGVKPVLQLLDGAMQEKMDTLTTFMKIRSFPRPLFRRVRAYYRPVCLVSCSDVIASILLSSQV